MRYKVVNSRTVYSIYFKRVVQPKYELQMKKCVVKNKKMKTNFWQS